MKSRICALFLECLKFNQKGDDKVIAISGATEDEALRRLNEMRLQQLSAGWMENSKVTPRPKFSSELNQDLESELPLPVVPMTDGPKKQQMMAALPTLPSDSQTRLDAFILKSQTVNPLELES